jgi:hypothetical protein
VPLPFSLVRPDDLRMQIRSRSGLRPHIAQPADRSDATA